MKKTKKYFIVVPIVLLVILCAAGVKVWKEHRDILLKNQEDQLLLMTKVLRDNMEVTMEEYQEDLRFLCGQKTSDEEALCVSYMKEHKNFICNFYEEDTDGEQIFYADSISFEEEIVLAEEADGSGIWMMSDEQNKYLVFKEKTQSGSWLCMVMDAESYYQRLISDIHVGTNGYIVIKNQEGTIIMHPDETQWGLHVIRGRKERYPDLDYSSLENMLEEQRNGNEGVSRYYSYWWTQIQRGKVEKISTYCSLNVGSELWIISAVIDYDDFYKPIAEGFVKMIMVFAGAMVLVGGMILVYGRMLNTMRKSAREIQDLRELNSLLESVQKSENVIAHQERLQIMGTMTGGIAHEFNNFLTPIMGHAELLMMELPEGSEEQDSAREIYEASEKARDVVRQISSLSRKNVETVYKCVVVRKMMQRVLKMIASVCPASVKLESDVQIEDECILGNTTQLNQVLLNISVNAIHAIGQKEGIIEIRTSVIVREELQEILEKEIPDTWQNYLYISVRDNGCGMDKDTLRQIFDPFFTTKKGGEGTGLGLALAEQIITSHKGYLFARSQVGEGSTFYIAIPLLEENLAENEISVSEKREIQMILADDNAKVLNLLKKNFEKIGIRAEACSTIEEVSKVLKQENADVLVIEESIEGRNSVDYCMSIAGKYPDMLKFISIDSISREIVEAKRKGIIDGYVEKPISDRSILEAIREAKKES